LATGFEEAFRESASGRSFGKRHRYRFDHSASFWQPSRRHKRAASGIGAFSD